MSPCGLVVCAITDIASAIRPLVPGLLVAPALAVTAPGFLRYVNGIRYSELSTIAASRQFTGIYGRQDLHGVCHSQSQIQSPAVRSFPNRRHARLLLWCLQRKGFRTREWFFTRTPTAAFGPPFSFVAECPKLPV